VEEKSFLIRALPGVALPTNTRGRRPEPNALGNPKDIREGRLLSKDYAGRKVFGKGEWRGFSPFPSYCNYLFARTVPREREGQQAMGSRSNMRGVSSSGENI